MASEIHAQNFDGQAVQISEILREKTRSVSKIALTAHNPWKMEQRCPNSQYWTGTGWRKLPKKQEEEALADSA
jgi:hypothetical protein